MPAASPEWAASTALMATAATLGVIAAKPTPRSRYGPRKTAYGVFWLVSAIAPIEAAAATQPAAITRAVPKRLPARPANGASTPNERLIGTTVNPASKGL